MFYVSKKLTNECGMHHCRNHEICEENMIILFNCSRLLPMSI